MNSPQKTLITGGCGFIGSHLAEKLLANGDVVTVLDNLSTGRYENVSHLEANPDFHLVIGSVLEEKLVSETIRSCDRVFHLASAVGVNLIMTQRVHTIETILQGTRNVLHLANRYRKRVVIASTSEVYGKSTNIPFREDGDRLQGGTDKHRWAYAGAKAMDEFLALAYHSESKLPVVVVRLFNTVGPRQTGQYGMVIPNFVQQALNGEPIRVFGTGKQTRCFTHVADVTTALEKLIDCEAAFGQVINIGSEDEISIRDLAELIRKETGSTSEIRCIPYSEVYGEGFEDMQRRVPCIKKIGQLIQWQPTYSVAEIVKELVIGARH